MPYAVQERYCITAPFNRTAVRIFSENEIVPVRILSVQKDGSVRISLKGQIIHAQASSAMQEGAFLLMQVQIKDNTVLLVPASPASLPAEPHPDVFTQLGIPSSPLAALLIDYFRQNELPLQTRPLLKILASLHRFAPHEKKAAFAAALLYSHGIEPSPPLIQHCFTALFGLSLSPSATLDEDADADMFRFINHVKARRRHWIVFPFTKHFDVVWKGSAAFLLDLHDTLCLECCVRFRSEDGGEAWFFRLKDHECVFSYQGAGVLSETVQKKTEQLLQSCFKDAGIHSFVIRYQDCVDFDDSLASIDISV